MKSLVKGTLRTVVVFTALCLLIAALPAAVHAADYLLLESEIGFVGSRVNITGYDFDHNSLIYIYMSPIDAKVGKDYIRDLETFHMVLSRTTDADGGFSSYFFVPETLTDGEEDEDVKSGPYYIYITEARTGKIKAKAEIAIAGTSIKPTEGKAGTEVSIRGAGYEANENITVYFDDDSVPIPGGDTATDVEGKFNCTIEIPAGVAGEHTITFEDESGHQGRVKFIVEPGLTVTPSPASKLDEVAVRGTGFAKRSYVDIYFDDVEQILAGKLTDDHGSFNTLLTLLPNTTGSYSVRAEDEEKNNAKTVLIIVAGISVSPDTGNVGTPVMVNGTGFEANAIITITYDNNETPVTTATANSFGQFTATFNAPASEYGLHSITATDGTSTADTSFIMESGKPATPVLVAPKTDAKAPPQTTFEWEGVDDPSGVVYSLEIATSDEFTTESMVLQKTGLTEAGYTLTKAEELKTTERNEPYYWRVKAIDGASNESEWTRPGAFYVGSTFKITDWIPYTLMAIGGLLIIFFAFWLKRRMD
jgi:hypothetical protein